MSDSDLALAAPALRLLAALHRSAPALGPVRGAVCSLGLPPSLELLRSALLQGAALEATRMLFAELAAAQPPSPGAAPEQMLAQLLGSAVAGCSDAGARQAQANCAKCVAALCVACGLVQMQDTVGRLLASVQTPTSQASARLALLCLGEIGRCVDFQRLSSSAAVESAIAAALRGGSEELRAAGAVAMGGIVAGNTAHYLPGLMAQVAAAAPEPRHQYLLLTALHEVIAAVASSTAGQQAAGQPALSGEAQVALLPLLLAVGGGDSGSDEEVRGLVAECLGRLALLPGLGQSVIPALTAQLSAPAANTRLLVVSAIKYCVVERGHEVDPLLAAHMAPFLERMGDEDRHVRRAAVVALSAAAHAKPVLVADALPALLPLLYAQTVVREELIRVVDLGPFKHRVRGNRER